MLPSPLFPKGTSPKAYLVSASNFKLKISGQHSFLPSQYSTTYRLNGEFVHHQHTLLGNGRMKKEKKENVKIIWFRKQGDVERIPFFVPPPFSIQRNKHQIPKRPGARH